MMKKKILSLVLTLALCLGLTVPVFAETCTETFDGITITANSNGTISYTGAGELTWEHMERGVEMIDSIITGKWPRVTVIVGPGITCSFYGSEDRQDNIQALCDACGVLYDPSATVPQTTVSQTVGGFTDVKPGDYFANPVVWAVEKKITAGTSKTTFSPNENCTVAQILTFLYKAYRGSAYGGNSPFTDVKTSDWYYSAARWAYEKGIISGNTFGGDRPCTRAMAVDYMWKAACSANLQIGDGNLIQYNGRSSDVIIPNSVTYIGVVALSDGNLTSVTIPTSVTEVAGNAFFANGSLLDVYYEGSEEQWKAINFEFSDELSKATIHYNYKRQPVSTGFTDVPGSADYAQAVKWVVDKGVTSGTTATTFSPDSVCTRGQIVTFLHRALAK